MRPAVASKAFIVVLVVALFGVILAYQFDTAHVVDVGGYYDRVYVHGFHEREVASGEDFRWSTGSAEVRFPGVGPRGRWLSLRLHGWRPAGHPWPEVQVGVNGQVLATLSVGPEWQEYRIWVPAQVGGGTPRVTLDTEPFVPAEAGAGGDVRPLGVAVSLVGLIPLEDGGFSPGWPAFDQLAWALLFAAALYLSLSAVMLPRWGAALVAGVAVLALSWGLAWHSLWTTIYTARLAVVALLGLLLLPLVRWLFGRIFAWGKVPFGEKEMRLLLAIFLLGFLIKAAGLLYPYSVAIDLKWHLEKSTWILDGRLGQLYRPGAFSESVMPPEWGESKPIIPYSPFYHLTAVLYFFLPWRAYDTANVISVLLDTTKPFLIYFLARRLGLGRRVGLLAGLLYAVLPATFLLHSWGNMPTQTGMWWTLASTCYIVGAWERFTHPRTWAGLVALLLGTMLYYTVMAAFMVVFLGIFLLGLWLNGRNLSFRPLATILLALVVAVGLATAIYYGQYIRPIIEVTIPHFVESMGQGGANLGTVPVPWSVYVRDHVVRMSSLRYGLVWPILLAVGGLVIGRRHLRRPLLRWILIAWFGTSFVFFLLGFRVDMVDKEFFYAMPAISLCAAVALLWLWQRSHTGRIVVLVMYLFLAAAALQTWVQRLSTVTQVWTEADAPIVGAKVIQLGMLAWQVLFQGS